MAKSTRTAAVSITLANNVELVFSLDTTGSMYGILVETRRRLKSIISGLFAKIPGLKIGIIVHGDDAAYDEHYSAKVFDLTDKKDDILKFIDTCGNTKGGGPHANYEVVLQEARKMSWTSSKAKALVIVGDEVPHKIGQRLPSRHPGQVNQIDWENELSLLHGGLGVNVYGVHCLPGVRHGSETFYKGMAQRTKGHYLTLDQFDLMPDLITLCCYQAADSAAGNHDNVTAFESELTTRQGGRLDRNRVQWFTSLLGKSTTVYKASDLEAVPAGKFQRIYVAETEGVIDFCSGQNLAFKKGWLYQRLDENRTVCEVSAKKEIVLRDKVTGDLYSGVAARRKVGLPDSGTQKLYYRDHKNSEYEIYIQSTSHNRNLEAGQYVLYNLDGIA